MCYNVYDVIARITNLDMMALTLMKNTKHKKDLSEDAGINGINRQPQYGTSIGAVSNVMPFPLELQNLFAQNGNFTQDMVNRLFLQRATNPLVDPMAIFGRRWPSEPTYESPVVSSSHQDDHDLPSLPKSRRRRRKSEQKIDPRPPPVSPPISASSPISSGSDNANLELSEGRGGGKLYTCDICHKSFGYKHVLQNHERTHTGEKPFKCSQCDKRFTRDHHLKTHIRLHTGEKPYFCDKCNKRFVQVANLRRHMRVHTGEKPYQCKDCPSKFSDSNQLKAHKLVHNDAGKPALSCEVCLQQFRKRHHLLQHKCRPGDTTKNEDMILDDDEDSKASDDTDSSEIAQLGTNTINNNHVYCRQRWMPPTADDLRRRSPMEEAVNLSVIVTIPMQTEPEDLSLKKKRISTNNNNSSGSAGDSSSRSTSPTDEEYSVM